MIPALNCLGLFSTITITLEPPFWLIVEKNHLKNIFFKAAHINDLRETYIIGGYHILSENI